MSFRSRRLALAAVPVALGVLASPAAAQNLLVNGGFEAPALTTDAAVYDFNSVIGGGRNGWRVIGGEMLVLRDTYSESGVPNWPAAEGRQLLDISGASFGSTAYGVRQTVGTTAGTRYRLSFSVGRVSAPPFRSAYQSDAALDLSIDGGTRSSFVNSIGSPSGTINWLAFSREFVAAGSQTTVDFFRGSTENGFVGLDDVSLVEMAAATPNVVPEPSTYALLATALVALGGVARRHSA